MEILEEISALVQRGRAPKVKELIAQAVEQGISANTILEEGLLSAMSIVGNKFRKNEIFVPEVLVSARVLNAGLEILRPHLMKAGVEAKGVAIIGTVKGDLHDIGKNLVKMMLEGNGLQVIDLGVDVPAETFIEKAIEHKAQLICCSALLTTTMTEMKTVVEKAEQAGIRNQVKILIGGAPITQEFCDSIGADYYTPDGASAGKLALELCQQMKG